MLKRKKNMPRKHFVRLLVGLVLLVSLSFPGRSQAATFTNRKDTLSRLKISIAANHTICFNLATSWDAGETITIDFDDGFDTSGFANNEPEDFDIAWATTNCTGGTDKTIVAAGACAANAIEITSVNTTTDVFTFTLCSSSTSSGGTDQIAIEIGTNATFGATGNDQIVNPSTAGSKLIQLAGTINDTGDIAVGITAEDQTTVTASVGASLTFTVSPTSVNLGTLSTSSVSSATNTLSVTTNAANGFVITGQGTTLTSGSNTIPFTTDGTVTAGSREYGVAFSGGSGSHPSGDRNLTSTETVTTVTGPANNDQTTATYKASIDTTTVPGTYTSTITYIATGTF